MQKKSYVPDLVFEKFEAEYGEFPDKMKLFCLSGNCCISLKNRSILKKMGVLESLECVEINKNNFRHC